MKISSRNQSMKRFVAAASTLSALSNFASARIGNAVKEVGYDPSTTSTLLSYDRDNQDNDQQDLSLKYKYSSHGTQAIHDVLRAALAEEDSASSHGSPLRNHSKNESEDDHFHVQPLYHEDEPELPDLGVLENANAAPVESPNLNTLPYDNSCMIRYGDGSDDHFRFEPASTYLQRQLDSTGFYWNVLFDPVTNTITCLESNPETEALGCSALEFKGCDHVVCSGRESCFASVIKDASLIECHGTDACHAAELDAIAIDCEGDQACYSAEFGSSRDVASIRCHGSGASTCARARIPSGVTVQSMLCSGKASCAGADLPRVRPSGLFCEGDRSCGEFDFVISATGAGASLLGDNQDDDDDDDHFVV